MTDYITAHPAQFLLICAFVAVVFWLLLIKKKPVVHKEDPEGKPELIGEATFLCWGEVALAEPFAVDFNQRKWEFDPEEGSFSFPLKDGKRKFIMLGALDAFTATCESSIPTPIFTDRFEVSLLSGSDMIAKWTVFGFRKTDVIDFPHRMMIMQLSAHKQLILIAGSSLTIIVTEL